MPVPKRKLSRKRRDQRSANKHIIPQPYNTCMTEGCGVAILPHRVCYQCGQYKGEQILPLKTPKKTKQLNTSVA